MTTRRSCLLLRRKRARPRRRSPLGSMPSMLEVVPALSMGYEQRCRSRCITRTSGPRRNGRSAGLALSNPALRRGEPDRCRSRHKNGLSFAPPKPRPRSCFQAFSSLALLNPFRLFLFHVHRRSGLSRRRTPSFTRPLGSGLSPQRHGLLTHFFATVTPSEPRIASRAGCAPD